MNGDDFTVEGTYEGDWKFPMCDTFVFGTLIIEKGGISLRVLVPKGFPCKWRENIDIRGKAFKLKRNNRLRNNEFHFLLQNLRVLQFGNPSSSYHEITFDIQDAFISIEPDIDFTAINSCVIRTELLDKWCWEYISNSYTHNLIEAGIEQSLEYKQKEPYTCFQDEKSKIVLYFSTQTNHPSVNGFHIINKCFFNIFFSEKQNFEFAYVFAERIWHLFSLLWDAVYEPEYIEFQTKGNRFFYIQNAVKCEYRLKRFEQFLFTQLTDFTQDDLDIIIERWLDLYENNPEALGLYMETSLNERLSTQNTLKNYVSVIDGLTASIKTDRKIKDYKIEDIIQLLAGNCEELTENEKNSMILALSNERGGEGLKPRLRTLLLELENYPPMESVKKISPNQEGKCTDNSKEISDILDVIKFVEKVVNTRNYLTHPKKKEKSVISPEQYSEYTYILKKVLQVYILKKIGAPSNVIYKVGQMFL